jgi:hypothetical protein
MGANEFGYVTGDRAAGAPAAVDHDIRFTIERQPYVEQRSHALGTRVAAEHGARCGAAA